MGVLFDLMEFCEAKESEDQSIEIKDWLKQYPQYNTEPNEDKEKDTSTSIKLDSE